jgi:NADPH-dependent curcumin reductase CurA
MSHRPLSRRFVLAQRPVAEPRAGDFRLVTSEVPALRDGEISLTNIYLSMDPAIRGFLDDRKSYMPPVALGETVRGMTLGRVLESRNPAIRAGAFVRALAGWEEISVLGPRAVGLEVVNPTQGIPLGHYMGALGPTGLTAWIGLHEIGRIGRGQTVVISAAAGAVGSVAGQIAALHGCRVVGIVGSAAKAAHIKALGFHAAIDYRAQPDLDAAIRSVCPDGVDVYFDNVGGAVLEALLPLMREHGRVVVCGMVSDYNHQEAPYAVRTLWQIVVKRLTIRGFLTYEHADRIPLAQSQLGEWVQTGALRALDNIHEGIESAPAAFIALMSGATVGKTLVRLEPAHDADHSLPRAD